MTSIAENIISLKKDLDPFNASLVAVSKTKPAELIMEAYRAGQRLFGENYVQELEDKYRTLPKDIQWHFIGHLQTNKVKTIAPFVSLIHPVDSLKLLQVVNKEGAKNNRVINCLLQVFIAQEETKFGFSFDEVNNILQSDEFISLENICIKGLMGMASNTSDQNQVRQEFQNIKNFYNKLKLQGQTKNFKPEILSTGMSNDYKIALDEGSNMVRIGSLIFGER